MGTAFCARPVGTQSGGGGSLSWSQSATPPPHSTPPQLLLPPITSRRHTARVPADMPPMPPVTLAPNHIRTLRPSIPRPGHALAILPRVRSVPLWHSPIRVTNRGILPRNDQVHNPDTPLRPPEQLPPIPLVNPTISCVFPPPDPLLPSAAGPCISSGSPLLLRHTDHICRKSIARTLARSHPLSSPHSHHDTASNPIQIVLPRFVLRCAVLQSSCFTLIPMHLLPAPSHFPCLSHPAYPIQSPATAPHSRLSAPQRRPQHWQAASDSRLLYVNHTSINLIILFTRRTVGSCRGCYPEHVSSCCR